MSLSNYWLLLETIFLLFFYFLVRRIKKTLHKTLHLRYVKLVLNIIRKQKSNSLQQQNTTHRKHVNYQWKPDELFSDVDGHNDALDVADITISKNIKIVYRENCTMWFLYLLMHMFKWHILADIDSEVTFKRNFKRKSSIF